jgi:hypothetical protein
MSPEWKELINREIVPEEPFPHQEFLYFMVRQSGNGIIRMQTARAPFVSAGILHPFQRLFMNVLLVG